MTTDTVMIYVQLLDEGIKVYRPVKAEQVGKNLYEIIEHNPDDEIWEFNYGDFVYCEFSNDSLIALKKIDNNRIKLEESSDLI
jgi:hypothetical protein